MNAPLAYLHGQFVPFHEASLPLHDAGFVSGATIVDNARTFRHKLFRWQDHLLRFRNDCDICYVPLPTTNDEITAAAEELVARNVKLLPPGGELQLVTFATPGPLGVYLGEATNGPPTLGMVTYPLPFARYRRFFTEGVTLAWAGEQSSASTDVLPPNVKHRSRLFWHIAERRMRDPNSGTYHPSAIPVVFTPDGIGDTAIGSILVVEGDTVSAADPKRVQESISVDVVRDLCDRVGLRFTTESPSFMTRLKRKSDSQPTEILLAGTGFSLAGVREFVGPGIARTFPWPGPVYQKLLAAWSDMVGLDIAAQFTANA